jgi:ABC-type phosphate/phosphonate transport system substrate-binding protein
MIANLMMYQRPQLVESHNSYWSLIRSKLDAVGIPSPEHLSQDAEEFSVWKDPNLILSQTCGMPYRKWLHHQVELVGTPDFAIDGCPKGYYRSALVIRQGDQRGDINAFQDATFAYNQTFSQSGYAAPFWHLKPKGFWFKKRLHTEQHLLSAKAVADGRADIAALDAVSWRLMAQYEPFAAQLRVLEWTTPTPGLPLITARGKNADAIFTAVEGAINELQDSDRDLLGINGIVKIPKEAYLSIPNP